MDTERRELMHDVSKRRGVGGEAWIRSTIATAESQGHSEALFCDARQPCVKLGRGNEHLDSSLWLRNHGEQTDRGIEVCNGRIAARSLPCLGQRFRPVEGLPSIHKVVGRRFCSRKRPSILQRKCSDGWPLAAGQVTHGDIWKGQLTSGRG